MPDAMAAALQEHLAAAEATAARIQTMTSLPAEGLPPGGTSVPQVHFLQSVAGPAAAAPGVGQIQAQSVRVERRTLKSQLSSAQALIAELQVS